MIGIGEDGRLCVESVSDNSGKDGNTVFAEATDESLGAVTTTMTNISKPINLKKVDSKTGNVTNGAVFELHTNGQKLYFDSNNQILTSSQVLQRINSEGSTITDITSDDAVSAMEAAGITSSFTMGEITLKGAAMTGYTYSEADGFREETPAVYELVEISAPPGYIISEKSNFFKVRGIRNPAETQRVRYTGMKIILTDENGGDRVDADNNPVHSYQNATVSTENTMEVSLSNEAGAALPHTGGPGTKLFTILGIMFMALAGAGFMEMKRRRRNAA